MGYEGVLDFYLEKPGNYDVLTENKLLSMQWDEQQMKAYDPALLRRATTILL